MTMSSLCLRSFLVLAVLNGTSAFVSQPNKAPSTIILSGESTLPPGSTKANELKTQKRKLLELIGPKTYKDPVLADPITKEGIDITASKPPVSSGRKAAVPFTVRSPSNNFRGSSDTYLDLLEPYIEKSSSTSSSPVSAFLQQAIPYIPPNLRGRLSSTLTDGEFVPMRDLFTNPAVSYAYERGWRQNFATAGFPGPDAEARMAMDYFAPVVARVPDGESSVVVDMSCATGLFTRRFASSEKYGRVLGCDYSPSMLTEARRRIEADSKLSSRELKTSLDLVRLDVGRIPMRNETVDCLHAGAAMHCWPDLDAAASEIHRVLKPGGRYFATTFLSQYFSTISAMDGQANTPPSQQAFQYFESIDTLRELLVRGGFEREKIIIEVLGAACVVIRAEK